MMVRAVLFDTGGVLEITPDLRVVPQWEDRLGLPAGTLGQRPCWLAKFAGVALVRRRGPRNMG